MLAEPSQFPAWIREQEVRADGRGTQHIDAKEERLLRIDRIAHFSVGKPRGIYDYVILLRAKCAVRDIYTTCAAYEVDEFPE
jgi:hypothetical protein